MIFFVNVICLFMYSNPEGTADAPDANGDVIKEQ